MPQLFRRILVPHDFSDAANRALDVAVELAAGSGGRLTVLHAIAEFAPTSGFPAAGEVAWVPPENFDKTLREQLRAAVAKVVGRRRVPYECRVEIGDPYQRIIDGARRVDSIVMGTVGRTGLTHLLVGSVAEKVVRHSPVPVLTLRPAAARRAARAGGAKGGRKRSTQRAARRRSS